METINIFASGFGEWLIPWEEWAESLQAFLGQSLEGFAEAAWEFLSAAFASGSFTGDDDGASWWTAVIGGEVTTTVEGGDTSTIEHPGMLNVMVVAMIPVLFGFVAVQVIMSIIRASTAGMIRAVAVMVLAIPSTYIMASLVWLGLRSTDELTVWILDIGTSGDDIAMAGIYRLFGLGYNAEDQQIIIDDNFSLWNMGQDSDLGKIILPWLVAAVLTIITFFLMLMMIFRTTMTLLLTMFTPIALFSLSMEAAKGIFSKWAGLIVALLMSKPIAAAVVTFGVTLASLANDWIQLAVGVVLVIIAAAMPLLLMAIVSFMTPEGSRAMEGAAVGAGVAAGSRVAGSARRATGGAARRAGRAATAPGRAAMNRSRQVSTGARQEKGRQQQARKAGTGASAKTGQRTSSQGGSSSQKQTSKSSTSTKTATGGAKQQSSATKSGQGNKR